ncbi:MAG: PAS domain-containing sensor histidine kinase [Rhodospirillales bacterium]|nr:PAS domain-containing sensor histidine kinase [Rhodospirillales bacterium]
MTETEPASPAPSEPSAFARLRRWASRVGLSRKIAFVLAVLAVLSGGATYLAVTAEQGPDPRTVTWLLLVNLVLILALGSVVARELVRLWIERRRGLAGARLHVQLVALFTVIAGAPTAVMAVAAVLFFNLGVQAWFSDPVRQAIGQSLAAAQAYLDEHRSNIRGDIIAMANDISREGAVMLADGEAMQRLVSSQTAIRALDESVLFDGKGRIYARVGFSLQLNVPFWALDRARGGEVVIFTPDNSESDTSRTDRVRALVRVEGFEDTFLLIGRFVEPRVVQHLDRTRLAVQLYQDLEGRREGLQVTFAMMFVIVALLLLLAAIWIGIALANRLARPIGALIAAAERVRTGDLAARVDDGARDDELGMLSRAFNRMTAQLESQRGELLAANVQIENRRRFTEAVLASVTAGVVALDARGAVDLPNRSASQLLDIDLAAQAGQDFAGLVPEMAALIESSRANPDRPAQGTIQLVRNGRKRTFVVRIARAQLDDGGTGLVVTFDDVTDLEAAQRTAAWADVARRIAHEIKNPLTPIQLSAERLRRKYLAEIKTDPETFRLCTETIMRQVEDIGRMVDEFSSFARMPAPRMKAENIGELVRRTVFLQSNARAGAKFETDIPPQKIMLRLDAGQVGQALTNLLQNALDAIEGREGADLPPPHVVVDLSQDAQGRTIVSVADNGRGLPKNDRDRLTEPYMTTRAKGTGLGLAIVKKIMEDHGGTVLLADRAGGGAVVSLVFPSEARADSIAGEDSMGRAATAD